MNMDMMTMGWSTMLLWMAGAVLLLVVLVAAVVWILRTSTRRNGGPAASSAIEQLGTRYARGEIDREEYLRKASDLADRAE